MCASEGSAPDFLCLLQSTIPGVAARLNRLSSVTQLYIGKRPLSKGLGELNEGLSRLPFASSFSRTVATGVLATIGSNCR